ncbi:TonB-dependent receptor [Sphingobium sp. YR768]|uniref:TonB-dependent receptor n=1 Tax=Sphingobium sp. YR768 TaxID=1884365 RepID=UPI0008D3A15A|nr:TonB-dependent receptor [Sphingobium sp. YR768]SES18865.1 iron complex outermembrane recepter protein [Sphingobium sp. YR768]
MKRIIPSVAACTLAVASAQMASAAYAQDVRAGKAEQDASNSNQAAEDIVVTATRSSTMLMKTPVAVTAVSGDMVTKSGISDPTRLASEVPNLAISRTGTGAVLQITIRGVTSGDTSEKGDPSAAFLIDGIYFARNEAQDVSLYDLERIEVLRGPQGTLFGRNTTAGVVQIITKKPNTDAVSGFIDGSYGNFGAVTASGGVNIPLSPSVAVRGSVNYERRDSYVRPGPNFTSKLSPYRENISGRLSALFDLGGNGELVIRTDYSDIGGHTLNAVPLTNLYSNFTTSNVDPINIGAQKSIKDLFLVDRTFSGSVERRNTYTWGISGDLQYSLGPIDINYLGGYRRLKSSQDIAFLRGNGATLQGYRFATYSQNSHELRLSTNNTGGIKAQAGLYYFREQSDLTQPIIGFVSAVPNTTGYVFTFFRPETVAETYAAFGQVTYNITPDLHLTGGMRYSHDDKARVGGRTARCSTLSCNLPTDTSVPDDAAVSFGRLTWRVGFDWDVNARTLAYATVSTGYKAGGFNDGCEIGKGRGCLLPATALYYKPEEVTSYELGLKFRTADDTLRMTLAAFHYDYSDLQLSQIMDVNGLPTNVTTNAATAKIDGVELEGTISPSANDKISLSASYLDARYADFVPNTVAFPQVNFAGRPLDRSPNWAVSAGYTHRFDLANGGNVEANVRSRLTDKQYLIGIATLNQFGIPSYTNTDVSLTYNAPDKRWYVQAFGRNLENSVVMGGLSVGTFATAQLTDPRTYGVRGGFKF